MKVSTNDICIFKSTFILDIEGKEIVLIIIKASKRAPQMPDFKDDRVKKIRFILVDDNHKKMLECPYNQETIMEIFNFLTFNQPTSKYI